MKDQFCINKITIKNGWLDMTIQDADQETVITASYLSDAVTDFVMAVALLGEGQKERVLIWMNEPGETHWTFMSDGQTVTIKIAYLLYNAKTQSQEEELLYSGKVSLLRLSREVLRSMSRLNIDYPGQAYQKAWHQEYPYPEDLIQRLSNAIKRM